MRRIWKEIKAVGLRDWLWFVVRLRRNEFHPSLNRWRYDGRKGAEDIARRRERAHRIDLALADVRWQPDSYTYDLWLAMAKQKGWPTPHNDAFSPAVWVHYWERCYAYLLDPEAGRPVPPHRSGGGVRP